MDCVHGHVMICDRDLRVMIRGQDTPTSMLDNLWALWEMAFWLALCGSPAVFAACLEPDIKRVRVPGLTEVSKESTENDATFYINL